MKTAEILLICLLILTVSVSASCLNREYPVTQSYTETAYRTEIVREKCTENQTILHVVTGEYELSPAFVWYNQEISFSGTPNTWYYAYDIPKTPAYDTLNLKLKIHKQFQYEKAVIRIFDMSEGGHIHSPDPLGTGEDISFGKGKWQWITGRSSSSWLDHANININKARFLAGRTNLWSNTDEPVIEAEAGRAEKLAVIISGPVNRWNVQVTLVVIWKIFNYEFRPVTLEREVAHQVPYTVQRQRTVYESKQVPFWEAFLQP